jgi:putative ABC transport system permease protein
VLAGLAGGADRATVSAALKSQAGLDSYTRREFGWKTISYFVRNTGIPINFGVTVLLGCIVGIAICGQTFYLFVLENIKQLGALKAMGASNGQLVRMICTQAGLVGVLGYGVGVGMTALFFVVFIGTDLDFQVHWEVLALSAGAMIVITALACGASIRKVLVLEPGVVFKG